MLGCSPSLTSVISCSKAKKCCHNSNWPLAPSWSSLETSILSYKPFLQKFQYWQHSRCILKQSEEQANTSSWGKLEQKGFLLCLKLFLVLHLTWPNNNVICFYHFKESYLVLYFVLETRNSLWLILWVVSGICIR